MHHFKKKKKKKQTYTFTLRMKSPWGWVQLKRFWQFKVYWSDDQILCCEERVTVLMYTKNLQSGLGDVSSFFKISYENYLFGQEIKIK